MIQIFNQIDSTTFIFMITILQPVINMGYPRDVVANVLDCGIVVSKFELQSR